ncbi:MAG: PAS domain-containing protein [Planctomycetes bacterium]|nr:PAS domain-containing protein [Planctomycetota bacterium]
MKPRESLESLLRENQQRLTLALRAGGMAAWEWTGKKDIWTDELFELLELSKELEPSTALFFSRVHPDDLPDLRSAWQAAIDGHGSYASEFRIVLPGGRIRWLKGVGDVVRDDAGRAVRIYGLNWDITRERDLEAEKERLHRRARDASKAKSDFLTMLSHEIRTPLTAILGYADLVGATESAPQRLEYLRRIGINGRFLLGIVDDVLDLAKIEAGKLAIERSTVMVVDVLSDVRAMMEGRAMAKGLTLAVDIDGPIPLAIQTDGRRLRQILVNLVGNAIKFTEHGHVRVTARLLPTLAELAFDVADTGVGIAPADIESLFQPFTQVPAGITRTVDGTGLGLAISRRLAVMLGGEVSVRSEPGRGSTFTCTIAAGNVAGQNFGQPIIPSAAPPEIESRRGSAVGRILVIGGVPAQRDPLTTFLRAAGLEVEVAAVPTPGPLEESGDYRAVLIDVTEPSSHAAAIAVAERLRRGGHRGPLLAFTDGASTPAHDTDVFDATFTHPLDLRVVLDAIMRRPYESDRHPGESSNADDDDGRLRLLIIDDSVDAATLLQFGLEAHGYRTAIACNGRDAICEARRFLPHVVLSDLQLPDTDGFMLLGELRGLPDLAATRYVAISGSTERETSLRAGFDAHLVKPIGFPDLLGVLGGVTPPSPPAR